MFQDGHHLLRPALLRTVRQLGGHDEGDLLIDWTLYFVVWSQDYSTPIPLRTIFSIFQISDEMVCSFEMYKPTAKAVRVSMGK